MTQRPNILLITSDQQHWSCLGAINPKIQTPALDRLCREGTRFSRAYCPNPTCTPTRASIITGLYPSQHGAWSLGIKLPEDVPTVGQSFHEGGYRSTLVGKAHFQPLASSPEQSSLESYPTLHDLDFWRGFHGPWYGFDHIELTRNHADEAHAGQHYAAWMEDNGLPNWRDYFQKNGPKKADAVKRKHVWDLPERFHYSVWTAERTMAAMAEDVAADRPFFAWASFHDPHPPYLVPEPWVSMYDPSEMEPGRLLKNEMELLPEHFRLTQQAKPDYSKWRETSQPNHGFNSHLTDPVEGRREMATYYGMTSLMDQEIGRILDKLDELGIADNTLVVFSTDHGHFLGQHGLWYKGAFHYEDLLRVPFIVRWPGRVAAGAESDALQSLVDLAPTFLSAAGLSVPGLMQGVNQLPVWTGEAATAREDVIVEFRHQPTRLHLRTLVTPRHKMTIYRDQPYGELFDLQNDPDERRNLWDDAASQALKCEMFQRLAHAEIRREPTRLNRISGA